MDRRSNLLALSTGILSGPTAAANLQDYLRAFDKNTDVGRKNLSNKMGKLGIADVDVLQQAAKSLFHSCQRYGAGLGRSAAVSLLNEVTVALKHGQSALISQSLFTIMSYLAHTTAKMSWHDGLHKHAQDYYQLALRAAYAGHNRLFGARVLSHFAWQMYYMGKAKIALDLIQLAQNSVKNVAAPQVKAMLFMYEAWANAGLGHEYKFERAVDNAKNSMLQVNKYEEPYWVLHYDESQITSMAAGGLGLLAIYNPRKYAEQASELNQKAIILREEFFHRYTVFDYLGLAESRFLLKDTEFAMDACEKALSIIQQIQFRCGATRKRLHDIYQYTTQASYSARLQALNLRLKSVISV